jgi:DEAD/DEAH box helicase domain-containing protein
MNVLPDRYASDELVLRDPSEGRTLAQRLTKRYAARITGAFVVPGISV